MSIFFLATYVSMWILVLCLLIAVFALYHHFGAMYMSTAEGRASQGPGVSTQLKPMELMTQDEIRLSVPLRGQETIMVFSSVKCPLCTRLLPELREFAESRREVLVALVCGGTSDEVRGWAGPLVRR